MGGGCSGSKVVRYCFSCRLRLVNSGVVRRYRNEGIALWIESGSEVTGSIYICLGDKGILEVGTAERTAVMNEDVSLIKYLYSFIDSSSTSFN